jgi:cell division protein FtsB
MKFLVIILALLFLVFQYKLWLDPNGFWRVQNLKRQILRQMKENLQLSQRNEALNTEIKDLKIGRSALETHARNDLNMIRPNEIFYFFVDKNKQKDST